MCKKIGKAFKGIGKHIATRRGNVICEIKNAKTRKSIYLKDGRDTIDSIMKKVGFHGFDVWITPKTFKIELGAHMLRSFKKRL